MDELGSAELSEFTGTMPSLMKSIRTDHDEKNSSTVLKILFPLIILLALTFVLFSLIVVCRKGILDWIKRKKNKEHIVEVESECSAQYYSQYNKPLTPRCVSNLVDRWKLENV